MEVLSRRTLPTLADSASLRYAALAILYSAQGAPFGLMVVALPAYIAERNATPGQVGALVATAMLPWSLKLVAGPVMDRWSYPAMGRRRPWVILAQAGLALAFVLTALLVTDPMAQLGLLGAMAFTVNFFGAFQDVAVDGMAIEVLPVDEQARANGFMWGGQILGIAGATVGGSWLLDAYGLPATALAAALAVLMVMAVPVLLRERPGEKLLPWTAGTSTPDPEGGAGRGWIELGRSLFAALLLPASLVVAASFFCYRIGVGLNSALLPVMTVQELSWNDTRFAELNASARLVMGIFAMVVGGWLVERGGRRRVLLVAGLLHAALMIAMGLLPHLWPERGVTVGFMALQMGLDAAISIAYFAVAMGLCRKRVAATQYALYMALSNLGYSVGSGLLGSLREGFGGYAPLFLVVAATTLGMVAAMRFADLSLHSSRLERLDAGPATVD